MDYLVVIEKTSTGYSAYVPDLPGCTTVGDTKEEIIAVIEKDGWYQVGQRGSHHQFKHPTKSGRVTIPDHGRNNDLAKGTESSILKQAGLK